MKAISLKQPWASFIADGLKTIETRTWPTKYRGDILIVASKNPKISSLPTGRALCIAEIIDCRPMTKADEKKACCDLYPGAYAWVLNNIRQIRPFDVKGKLGIYDVSPRGDGAGRNGVVMKIAVKTRITEWGAAGDKEKISFDILDFSPDQVADIDRLIRNNSEDPVSLSIEPVQKKLQIAPIVSQVRLVSMNCMTGGQKLKIADFKSPDERATAMKRLTNTDTQIMLTIEDVQNRLFDESQPEQTKMDFDRDDYTVNDAGVVENPSVLKIELPKNYKTNINIEWARIEGKIYCGCEIEGRNISLGIPVKINHPNNPPFDSLADALTTAQDKICAYVKDNKFKNHRQIQTQVIKTVENYIEGSQK